MAKLNPEELVVTSFETDPLGPSYSEGVTTDPTPDTHCFVCGYSEASCDAFCVREPA